MAATNSVAQRTGNVSAGTSVFAMIVLEKDLSKAYPEIDLVTTPSGDLVAMVHCNNCTSDLNAWVSIFKEFADAFGVKADMNELFGTLYNLSLIHIFRFEPSDYVSFGLADKNGFLTNAGKLMTDQHTVYNLSLIHILSIPS